MSEPTPLPDSCDLGLEPYETQPIRRYAKVSWSDWLDEMQPYVERYYELAAEGRAQPRRTPWDGTFEL
jgi:hypothetical protein